MTEKSTSFLELFFDLVFVFAITQLAGLLHADHTAAGWGRVALVAGLVWWAWSQYTWAGNAIDVERRGVRLAVLGVTGLVLLAGVAMPGAFAEDGLWFALPYVAVRFAGLALYWFGLRNEPEHQAALRSFVPVASISPVLVLAGGLADPSIRPWVWAAALAVDVASALAAGRGEFRVSPSHFAERHALIVIIALGESIVAIGLTATDLEPTAALTATVAVAFLLVATLWWAYFDRLRQGLEQALGDEADHVRRSSLARDAYTFAHFPVVAGPVAVAVALEEAVAHPADPLGGAARLALAVGVGLFLLGTAIAARRVGRPVPWWRVGAAALVAVLVVVGGGLGAMTLVAAVAGVLVIAGVAENGGGAGKILRYAH